VENSREGLKPSEIGLFPENIGFRAVLRVLTLRHTLFFPWPLLSRLKALLERVKNFLLLLTLGGIGLFTFFLGPKTFSDFPFGVPAKFFL